MANHPAGLSQWIKAVSTQLPVLSKTQITVVAMYSFGMVMVGSCGISSIVCLVAGLLAQPENTVRQRLREITYAASDKRGQNRRTLHVQACFASILSWVIAWWEPDEGRVALALDATTLGQRFTVLTISVMYRGSAIPVAWAILPATQKGAWMPHWKRLLRLLRGAIPADWTVIVLTDHGLYSKPLFKAIRRNQWHPMMRINTQGKYRVKGEKRWRLLSEVVPKPGTIWYGEITCFMTESARLHCTLLAHWDAGFDEPWLLLTDLPPETADSLWLPSSLRPFVMSRCRWVPSYLNPGLPIASIVRPCYCLVKVAIVYITEKPTPVRGASGGLCTEFQPILYTTHNLIWLQRLLFNTGYILRHRPIAPQTIILHRLQHCLMQLRILRYAHLLCQRHRQHTIRQIIPIQNHRRR